MPAPLDKMRVRITVSAATALLKLAEGHIRFGHTICGRELQHALDRSRFGPVDSAPRTRPPVQSGAEEVATRVRATLCTAIRRIGKLARPGCLVGPTSSAETA